MTYEFYIDELAGVLSNAALITGLVMIMLLLIEYINERIAMRQTRTTTRTNNIKEILWATLLGAIPCCVGGFAAVSLFVHGNIGFGALLASLVASMGDEALVMFSLFPKQALILQVTLMVIGFAMGVAVQRWGKRLSPILARNVRHICDSAPEHSHSSTHCVDGSMMQNLKHITLQRTVLIVGLVLFIVAVGCGTLGHSHEHNVTLSHAAALQNLIFDEQWLNALFMLLAVAVLAIVLRVDEHFLREHLLQHIVYQHFIRIFLWVVGALVLIAALEHFIEARMWISHNPLLMLLAALLVGFIPASGPHLIFVLLYANGDIPLGGLFANMLMQDGHAGLPLLAESKRSFIYAKLLKLLPAALVGIVGIL
jgi:prepilin-type processing-associated H-X9-DG protein